MTQQTIKNSPTAVQGLKMVRHGAAFKNVLLTAVLKQLLLILPLV